MTISPELKAAVNHLQSHAQGMRAVLTIAEAISDIAKLEQLSSEAQGTLDAKRREIAAADGKVNAAALRLADIEQKAIAATSASQERSDVADLRAAETLAVAEEKAKSIIADGETKAQAKIDAVQGKVAELEAQCAALVTDLAGYQSRLEAKRVEMAEVEGRAQQARDYLAKLQG